MKTNHSEKGFSLIELMVALGIMVVGMAAVGVMLLSSFQEGRHNRNVRNADTVLRYFSEQFSAGKPWAGGPCPRTAHGRNCRGKRKPDYYGHIRHQPGHVLL